MFNIYQVEGRKPYSFQMLQKYISKISSTSLERLLIALNKIAIAEGLEDLKQLRIADKECAQKKVL